MFNNVGGSLKGIATVICWIGIISSCAAGLMGIVSGVNMNNNYYSDGSGTALIVGGIVIMVVGSLVSWAGSLVTYGFGELIENSDIMSGKLQSIEEKVNSFTANNSVYSSAPASVSKRTAVKITSDSRTANDDVKENASEAFSSTSPKNKDELEQIIGNDVEWIDVNQAGEMGQKLLSLGLYRDKTIHTPSGMSEEDARAAGYRSWRYVNGSKQFFRSVRTVPALTQEQFDKIFGSKS